MKIENNITISERSSKRAELEKYFPGLYNQKPNQNSKPSSSYVAEGSFAKQLEQNLSRSDIQKEIQSDPQKKKLHEAALEFQSLFLDRMLTSMRKNLNPKSDLLYGGFRQKIFDDMLYQEYSRMLSRTDNFGLADDIYRQMRPTLEGKGK